MLDIRPVKRQPKIVAVADIGSASAAVALLSCEPGHPAEVLASERSILPIEERSKEATIAAIGEHLVLAGEKVAKTYITQKGTAAQVEELYCVIRAPWIRSLTLRARTEFKEEAIVADSMIAALAKDSIHTQTDFDQKNILEATVIRVELNGYPTSSPAGKHAHQLEVWALVSDCESKLRAQVQTSLQRLFPHLTPLLRSSTRTVLSALQERPQSGGNYLIADVGSEGTTLVVVRDGALAEQHFVPEGVRSMLKRIAPAGMPEETLALIHMLEQERCSTAACEAVQSSMAKIEPDLVRVYGEGMTACAAQHRLPDKLILIAQPDMASWLAKFFSRIDFTQFTLTTQPFSVEAISPKDLAPWVTLHRGVLPDTGVALSAALVSREQNDR